jgi:long-subunit acyl-CoA synthetase (AMP-forming)
VDDISGGGRARRGRGIGARRSRHLAQGAHRGVWNQLSRVDDRNAGEEKWTGEREKERERGRSFSLSIDARPTTNGKTKKQKNKKTKKCHETSQACNRQNLFCVPLYDSLGENAVQFILEHSTASAVFVAADKLAPLAAAVNLGGLAPALKAVVVWGDVAESAAEAARAAGLAVTPWSEFLSQGQAEPAAASPPSPADLCTIMYTSGTTGDPKGVELSHGAVVSTVAGMEAFLASIADGPRSFSLGVDDVMLSYLPLAHIFDRVAEELMLNVGGRVGYFQGEFRSF